jgi:hypothetical protein
MDDKIKEALNDLPAVNPRPEFRSTLRQELRSEYGPSLAPIRKKRSILAWASTALMAALLLVFIIPPQANAHIETAQGLSLAQQNGDWVRLADRVDLKNTINHFYIPTGSKTKIVLPEMGSFTAANDCRVDFDSNTASIILDGGILEVDSIKSVTIILSGSKKIIVKGRVEINLCVPGGICTLKEGEAQFFKNQQSMRLGLNQNRSLSMKLNKTVSQVAAKKIFYSLKAGQNVGNILSLDPSKKMKESYLGRLVLARRLQDTQSLNALIFSLPRLKNLNLDEQYEVLRLVNSHSLKDIIKAQKRAFVGVSVTGVPAQLKALFRNHGIAEGVIVNRVLPKTPAAKAGLKRGDVIISVNQTSITTKNDLFAAILTHQPEDQVDILYLRGKEKHIATVTLADAPSYLKSKRPDFAQLKNELQKNITQNKPSANINYMQRLNDLMKKMSADE